MGRLLYCSEHHNLVLRNPSVINLLALSQDVYQVYDIRGAQGRLLPLHLSGNSDRGRLIPCFSAGAFSPCSGCQHYVQLQWCPYSHITHRTRQILNLQIILSTSGNKQLICNYNFSYDNPWQSVANIFLGPNSNTNIFGIFILA